MAEAGLYLGWGTVARGREKGALALFNESMEYHARLQKEGRIGSFDVAVLHPTGGDNGGFILVKGTAAQIDALRRDEEYQDLMNRVLMHVDGLCLTDATVDEGLGTQITRFDMAIAQLT